jgi:hypothetical protein
MPAYLVELPESATYGNLARGADKLVVFAADVAGARAGAAGFGDGDGDELWLTLATVTEIVAGVDLADAEDGDWSCYCRISGAAAQTPDPIVLTADGKTRDQTLGILGADHFHVSEDSIVITDGGTGYINDDILTLSNGTGRAASFRVVAHTTGVIDAGGLELVDPGDYSVFAPDSVHTGSANNDATFTFVQADVNGYEALIAQIVSAGIAAGLTSSVDLSETLAGARLLTLATIGDNIGDATVEFEIRNNGTAFGPLVGAITDGGIAGAVLTVAIPASPLAPPRIVALKSTS